MAGKGTDTKGAPKVQHSFSSWAGPIPVPHLRCSFGGASTPRSRARLFSIGASRLERGATNGEPPC